MPSPELNNENKAVILLSGGLDSAVTLAWAKAQGYSCFALTIDYGQRHSYEIQCAAKVGQTLGVQAHKILKVDLAGFGGSALTQGGPLPPARAFPASEPGIPSTYVPARNTIFLSLALSWAEILKAAVILIGANAIDYSGYPDCRPEYLEAFNSLIALATKAGVEGHAPKVVAPLLHLSKAEIVRLGKSLGLDFSLTSSCYNPSLTGKACGQCESCLLRRQGFSQAGENDPRE